MESILNDASHVITVDARLYTGDHVGYLGHFKIAVDTLMPKCYAALRRCELVNISVAVNTDGIWRGIESFNVDRDFEHTGRLKRMLPPTNKLLPSYWYHWGISQLSCAQFGERTLVWPEEARHDAIVTCLICML